MANGREWLHGRHRLGPSARNSLKPDAHRLALLGRDRFRLRFLFGPPKLHCAAYLLRSIAARAIAAAGMVIGLPRVIIGTRE